MDRKLHNPIEDRLIPLEPLDLSSIRSIDDLVRAMSKTAFTGRQVGEAADVLETMARDKDCFVVMTLAGAMTVAKQGLIVAELIDRGIVNAIVSTGALMAKHAKDKDQRGILKSAYEKGVPVFVPAFTDSELGLDVALHNRMRESSGRHKIRFDPFEDLEHFASTLLRQTRLGIFTIGGGVPRNWSQQFGPFIELRHRRLGENLPLKRYHYGVRICPEPVYWGGLSGSPYSEAISSGKFVPPAEGGRFGEVFVDATVGLPLIVTAVLERLDKDKGAETKTKKEKAHARK